MEKITQAMIEEAASRLRGTGHWEGDLTRQQRNQVRQLDVPQRSVERVFRVLWVPTRGPRGNMVEFWDLRYAGLQFGRDGQFVSAYYADTIVRGEGHAGLVLDGGVDVWRIDQRGMAEVRRWVRDLEDGR